MSAITTADFPQADRLLQVGAVAMAVKNGHQADTEIEDELELNSRGRQGRYYRLAAEILGLVTNHKNQAELTALGEKYARLTNRSAKVEFLARRLLVTPVFQQALAYIEKDCPSDRQLKNWFRDFYPGKRNTADRRFSTFQHYLRDSNLVVYEKGNRISKFALALRST